jgi:hypothetical protein
MHVTPNEWSQGLDARYDALVRQQGIAMTTPKRSIETGCIAIGVRIVQVFARR